MANEPNKKLTLLWSLKRSGSHGIVGWLHPHFKKYSFFNNRPFVRLIDNKRSNLVSEPKDALIISFEDFHLFTKPCDYKDVESIIKNGGLRKKFGKLYNVILLRDPFNLIASRMKGWDYKFAVKTKPLWKIYAREFLGETNHLVDILPRMNSWDS